ncbi:MAG: FtsQ-type POTRA domain-containing protein [Oscillospiraceae bacterium]|jgi:cell division septal protein FtsQ|nr:FtsQ-type POTRA domain-containing protein [Oscillospiraceae bacterium]MDD3261012.1 FtsQ-type POTRA domain-containing protein [Oscillospiraceae bacterium]
MTQNDVKKTGRTRRRDTSPKQRQRAYQRMRHRKRMQVLFYILAFLAVLVTAVVLCVIFLFQIRTIEVSGTSRYTVSQITAASGVKQGTNWFQVNTDTTAKNVEKACPYLTEVAVSRQLPSKVIIQVKEGKPSGAVLWNGKYILMDKNGRVMVISDSVPSNVPVIKGLTVQSAELGSVVSFADNQRSSIYRQVTQAIVDTGFSGTTAIDVSDIYNISVACTTKNSRILTIKLGNSTYLQKKFRFAKATIDQHLSGEQGTFDVSSVSKEKSVTWFTPSSAAASSTASQKSASSAASSSASSAASQTQQQSGVSQESSG